VNVNEPEPEPDKFTIEFVIKVIHFPGSGSGSFTLKNPAINGFGILLRFKD
jgi:hypothetical protein